DWPFMWRLGVGDLAAVFFPLDQFSTTRHPAFGYRTQTAGVQSPTSPDGFVIDYRSPDLHIGICTASATSTWATGSCNVETPNNTLFDDTGGMNSMALGGVAPPTGGP